MSDDATDADARYQERIIMADRPHVDGLTRGTVVEYDGWQWGVVTEIAEETEPTKVGFVLLDEIGDWIVRQLEDADGCAEHYQAVRTFRDGEHEYWTPAEYIRDDDMWEILGPIHPDAREGELVTDGGVDQSEAGLDRDRAEELLGDLDDSTLLKYPLGPAPVWAYEKKDYLMLVRADGGTFRESSTTHGRVVEHLQDAFWNELFGTEPSLVDINEAPEEVRRAAK